ncbi:MAG: hypothetical protein FWD01_04845, partial [Defluviitaleaceae bacterium]|nr:hypothetical protein [Defluviitaleaceae bacterium]
MRGIITNALNEVKKHFGDEIFSNPTRFKAALGDIIPSERPARNLMNIAIGEMKVYSRLKNSTSGNMVVDVHNLAKEMEGQYFISSDISLMVMECFAGLLGYKPNTVVAKKPVHKPNVVVAKKPEITPKPVHKPISAQSVEASAAKLPKPQRPSDAPIRPNEKAPTPPSRNDKSVKWYPDGSAYRGELRNGKRHGQGTLWSSGGSDYQGEWRNGERWGQGT